MEHLVRVLGADRLEVGVRLPAQHGVQLLSHLLKLGGLVACRRKHKDRG